MFEAWPSSGFKNLGDGDGLLDLLDNLLASKVSKSLSGSYERLSEHDMENEGLSILFALRDDKGGMITGGLQPVVGLH